MPHLLHLPPRRFQRALSLGLRSVFVFLALAGRVAADEFIERVWLLDEGLPHNVVNRVIQDGRGFLWLATTGGMARFDGRNFRHHPIPDAVDGRQSVRDIAHCPDGSIALLPANGGIAVLREGTFSTHPATALLPPQTLTHLFTARDGALWITGSMLYRWHDGQLERFSQDRGGPNSPPTRALFASDRKGDTWIAAAGSLFCHRDGKLSAFPGLPGRAQLVAAEAGGGVWVKTDDALLRIRGDAVETILRGPELQAIGDSVALSEDDRGALWMATRTHGVYRVAGGTLSPVVISHPRLSSLTHDSEGNLWLASTGGGLIRVRPRVFKNPNTESGVVTGVASSLCESADGTLWIANRGSGLSRWKDDRLEKIQLPDGGASTVSFFLTADTRGRIWSVGSSGLQRFPVNDPGSIERVPFAGGRIFGLFCASNGDVWISATTQPLGFFRDDVYRPVTTSEGLPKQQTSAFAEDAGGNVWIAVQENELYRFDPGGTLVRESSYAAPHARRIHALHVDFEGTLWLGTRGGLIRKRGAEYRLISEAHGLPDEIIMQILEDARGNLWIGSRRGIFSVPLEALNAIADGRRNELVSSLLGRNEGLVGAFSFLAGPPTTVKARNGHLWFATYRGPVGIDPTAAVRTDQPPPVYIDAATVGGRPLPFLLDDRPSLEIPAGSSQIEFRFVALNFAAPEKTRFRHRLAGLDSAWNESASERSVTYAQLPPGDYTLEVTACNQSGAWNKDPATLRLHVRAAWWQTGWFRFSAAAGAIAAIVFGARRWAHRRLQLRLLRLEQAHALEQERARIARDLHDELGGSLTQLGLLAERMRRRAARPEMEQPLRELANRTRELSAELESVVWTLSPKNTTWSALADFIAGFARRFFANAELPCMIEGVDTIPLRPVSPEVQHHVLAIAKEAVNNLCKHARASRATLRFGVEGDRFALTLSDDGVGFDPGAAEHTERNGLTNIRGRAREIDGELEIASARGRGTRLALRVRLDRPAPGRSTTPPPPASSP